MSAEGGAPALVLDNGTSEIKAGFAGDEAPRAALRVLVGRPRYEMSIPGTDEKDHYVGAAAQSRRGVLDLTYPMSHGTVTNWDDMERVWRHLFDNELNVKSEDHHVLMTEPPLNPKTNKEKMAEIMFETFKTPGFLLQNPGVLCLYSVGGRTTGVVMDSGDGVTQIIPVYEGHIIPHAIQRVHLAGQDITSYLATLLHGRGYSFKTPAELEIVRDLKHKLGYVSQDFQADLVEDASLSHLLPDASELVLGSEAFQCAEAMFQPGLLGSEVDSAHQLLYTAIQKCDIDLRRDLYANIVLCGGNTMFTGFPERLRTELTGVVPTGVHVRLIAPRERRVSVWLGGSLLASRSGSFRGMWITKQEYDEHGVAIVHRKNWLPRITEPAS